ncbi:MAG: hypothetical protein PHV18_10360 [Lachnospiraceae bacterium]|nr:hypothetical protein [Lachnospiraceae bacterium]
MRKVLRNIKQKAAVLLSICMLISMASPLTGLAKTFDEAPIGGDVIGSDNPDDMPKAHIKVDVSQQTFEVTTDDLKETNEFETKFTLSVDFDEIATPGDASASDWDADAWAEQIASELEFDPIFSDDSKALADKLGAVIGLEKNPYTLSIKINNPQEWALSNSKTITVWFNIKQDSITYPRMGTISVPGVSLTLKETVVTEEDVIPAQTPVWSEQYPGFATWNSDALPDEMKEKIKNTSVRVYRDGERLIPNVNSVRGYVEKFDLRHYFAEPGEYTFQAFFRMNNETDFLEDYWSEISPSFEYVLPEKSMTIPHNLRWQADGTGVWDEVPESLNQQYQKIYFAFLYVKNEATGEYEKMDVYFKSGAAGQSGFSSYMESDRTYKFRVMAVGDLSEYANSDLSDFSPEFVMDSVAQGGSQVIDSILGSDDVVSSVENTKLPTQDKETLKLAVQAYENIADKYAELEAAYKQESGKEDFLVETGESDISSDAVVVTGGILNGATGIKFDKPKAEDLNNANVSKYRKKSALNITLSGELEGELNYPVLITMPVPAGIDAEDLVIIHMKHDGNVETINPRINGNGTVSFAVVDFSTFFFVDSTSTSNGSSGGSGGSGGGGGSSSFAGTGTVTIDSKKGHINSVTGIIIGSGEGYSKWISEAPQAEGGSIRWKLQYADGTIAAGTIVTMEDGATHEQPAWEKINGNWYAFGADGYAKHGFVIDPALGGTFYVDIMTGMKTGWHQIDGKWYYFNPTSDGAQGKMAVSTTVDGYYVDEQGIWSK